MTLTNELKILGYKIKANEEAKISAFSSKKLDQYKYLTGEDLRYKPGVAEQVKFKFYFLGKVFNKGLDEKDKKKDFWKCDKILKTKMKSSWKWIKINKANN